MLFKINVYICVCVYVSVCVFVCVEGALGGFYPLIFVSRVLDTKIIYYVLALRC